MQMRGKFDRRGGEVIKAATFIEGPDQIAGERAVRRKRHVRPLRMLLEVSCRTTVRGTPSRASSLANDLVPLASKKIASSCSSEPLRPVDIGPAPDGDRGTEIGLGVGHHVMVPASEALRYHKPDAEGAEESSGPRLN